MEKFQNKYRIASARAPWWDYGWAGAYFITICTYYRIHYFGEIINGKMHLSPCGILADVFWHEIPHHAKNVELGSFVVMPNHIHGIIILYEQQTNDNIQNEPGIQLQNNNTVNNANNAVVTVGTVVETRHALPLPPLTPPLPLTVTPSEPLQSPKSSESSQLIQSPQSLQKLPQSQTKNNPAQSRFRNQGKNTISSIVGSYKSAVTKHAHRLGFDFSWQSRFHDHIIRNDAEFKRITAYIENNPSNWENDNFFK